jgi:hypothetical protein
MPVLPLGCFEMWLRETRISVKLSCVSIGLAVKELRGRAMRGILTFLIVASAFGGSLGAFAQHGDFAPKVQVITDFLKNLEDGCVSPAIPGQRPFKACREGTDPIALTIATRLPVRDDNGRVIDTCPAKLTATQVPGPVSVRMEVAAGECPEKTLKSGEFTGILAGLILKLADWVQKKEKPV